MFRRLGYTGAVNRYSVFGILTAILFVFLPFATSRHLFHAAVNTKHFLVVTVILVLLSIVAWKFWRGEFSLNLKKRPLLYASLALLAVYWLVAFSGVFVERSIFADIMRSSGVFFLTHIAFFSLALGEFFREKDWSLVRRTVVISTAGFAFLTILGVEGFEMSWRLFWTNLGIGGYTFGNSTFAGTYLLLALFVALIELVRTPPWSRWWNILTASSALIFFSPTLFNVGIVWGKTPLTSVFTEPALILGSARASSATAILLLVFFGGYLLLRKFGGRFKHRAVLVWGALFVVGALASVALLFTPGSVVQEKYIEASTAARLLVWEGGLAAFTERPFLGWGPENFEQAFQGHLSSRLHEDENLGEIWFDRAHNVVVDTLVDIGVIGALAQAVVIGAFLLVAYRAKIRGLIEDKEFTLLFALPFAHFLQLQTGFDTIGSFALLGFFGGYGLWLERTLSGDAQKNIIENTHRMIIAVALGIFILASAYIMFNEFQRQNALYRIFVTINTEQQLEFAKIATERVSSFESLRFSSASLIKGTLERIARGEANKETVDTALSQLRVYEERYLRYVETQPEYLRARLNLAYLYSVQTVLGENKLAEAREVITGARELAPESLVTPAMEALLELYSGNLTLAKTKAQEIVALNPNARFGREVLSHIEKQEKTFPNITVLKLENL